MVIQRVRAASLPRGFACPSPGYRIPGWTAPTQAYCIGTDIMSMAILTLVRIDISGFCTDPARSNHTGTTTNITVSTATRTGSLIARLSALGPESRPSR